MGGCLALFVPKSSRELHIVCARLVGHLPRPVLGEFFKSLRKLAGVASFQFKLSLVVELFGQYLIRCASVTTGFQGYMMRNIHSPAGSLLIIEVENAGYDGFLMDCQVGRIGDDRAKEDVDRERMEREAVRGAIRPSRRRDCMAVKIIERATGWTKQ